MSEKTNDKPAHEKVTNGVPHIGWQIYLDQVQSREVDDQEEIPDDRPNN